MDSFVLTGQTDVGQRRRDNQDAFICSTIWANGSALLAVIDGVGGYAGGDRAASIAKESVEHYMATPSGNPLSMLREAVVFANNQIYTQRQEELRLAHMCCVLTAAVVDSQAGKIYYVHVGDTRLYRYRQGILEKLTYDHSLVGIREDAHELTEAEAMQHPRRNEILRDVGSAMHRVDDADFLDSGEVDFLPGDQLLLCSDGLTDMLTRAQIKAVLDQHTTPDAQATELIRLANQQGGNDNITVVLAKHNAPAVQQPVSRSSGRNGTTVAAPAPVLPKPAIEAHPTPKQPTTILPLLGSFVAGILVALGWHYSQLPGAGNPGVPDTLATHHSPAAAAPLVLPANAQLDSLIRAAHHSPEHRLVLPADTFRLSKPLILNDSLAHIMGGNRPTVLLPADSVLVPVAIQIDRSGPVQLHNLVIQGFKTGIDTRPDTKLQLTNVWFQHVGSPIQAVVQQDTFRRAVVSISVQPQPDSSKTRRH